MNKPLIVLIIILAISMGFHIYNRYSADFFYNDGKIETKISWTFNAEGYKLLEDGFKIDNGNFLYYTEEIFESNLYTYRFRIIGIPVKYRRVDYTDNSAWGFPGLPTKGEMLKGWFSEGEKRFKETLPIVELYKNLKK